MSTSYVHKGKGLTVTITFKQALKTIQDRRPCSPASLRRYFRKLHVKPLGTIRTNPQRYPADAVPMVLGALGEKIVTLTQLRAVKRQAQKERVE